MVTTMTVSEMLRATGNAETGREFVQEGRNERDRSSSNGFNDLEGSAGLVGAGPGSGVWVYRAAATAGGGGEAKGWRSRSRATTTTMFLALAGLAGLALGRPLAGLCWD